MRSPKTRFLGDLYLLWVLLLLLSQFSSDVLCEEDVSGDVSGPVVKLSDLDPSKLVDKSSEGNITVQAETIAETIDKALIKEFKHETDEALNKSGTVFIQSVKTDEAKLETVAIISSKKEDDKDSARTNPSTASSFLDQQTSDSNSLQRIDKNVDRIIDSRDNQYVLSKPTGDVGSLVIDPVLVQDLAIVISSASIGGLLFESIRQPVINGYLVAGAIIGPGGFQLIQELVQVESLAQLGVQLLLFGLGLELSLSRINTVWDAAILGGSLQILLAMGLSAGLALLVSAPISQALFIGALCAMSSTSVVVKCLERTQSTNTLYGQITIGTLILQDCSVGMMFALLPLFRIRNLVTVTGEAASNGEHSALVVVAVVVVLLKICLALAVSALLVRTVLPLALRTLMRNASRELCQLSLVAVCVSYSWACGWLGISEELGAFLGGLTLNLADTHKDSEHSVPHAVEGVQNVMTALFVASIGLVMSPRFIYDHLGVLALGTICLTLVKGLLVCCVVRLFNMPWRTSLAVGVSMAHVGEFALVLLSIAVQIQLLTSQVYMFLLGVTALSLLTTPVVIVGCHRLLSLDTDAGARFTPAMLHHARSGKEGRKRVDDSC